MFSCEVGNGLLAVVKQILKGRDNAPAMPGLGVSTAVFSLCGINGKMVCHAASPGKVMQVAFITLFTERKGQAGLKHRAEG